MRTKSKDQLLLSELLLIFYYCTASARNLIYPMPSVTVPLSLLLALFLLIIKHGTHIWTANKYELCLLFLWITVLVLIFVNNIDIKTQLIDGGLIQLLIMVFFIFLGCESHYWMRFAFRLISVFTMIHAFATILFYYNYNVYYMFATRAFSGEDLAHVLKYYSQGYMPGLCSHFSSNGMYLAIGLAIMWNNIRYEKKNPLRNFCIILCAYALLLTSKRGPTLFIFLSIIASYIIMSNKNIFRKFAKLLGVIIFVSILYYIAAQYIPGAANIVNKFIELSDSDAGMLNGRDGLWDIAIDMFASSPIIGHGYGSYAVTARALNAISTTAHNYYLEIMAEQGLLGLILYTSIFSISLFYTIYIVRRLKNNEIIVEHDDIRYLEISMCIQIFIILYNITASSLTYYASLFPYMFASSIPFTIIHNYRYSSKITEKNS